METSKDFSQISCFYLFLFITVRYLLKLHQEKGQGLSRSLRFLETIKVFNFLSMPLLVACSRKSALISRVVVLKKEMWEHNF